ncbi:hypothetical protein ACVWWG_001784 [Bradyrhizobium sp. LB7.2]
MRLGRRRIRKNGIFEATIYNWKAKFGGMDVSEAKRLRALEEERAKVTKSLDEQMLNARSHFTNRCLSRPALPRAWTMAQLRGSRVRVLEWVDWFNNRTLLEPIGNIPPPKLSNATTPCWNNTPWQLNLNQMASGKPGAVQYTCPIRIS